MGISELDSKMAEDLKLRENMVAEAMPQMLQFAEYYSSLSEDEQDRLFSRKEWDEARAEALAKQQVSGPRGATPEVIANVRNRVNQMLLFREMTLDESEVIFNEMLDAFSSTSTDEEAFDLLIEIHKNK